MAQGRVGACDKFAGTDLYAEFAPRLSLSRLTGRSIGFGPVKDFLVAGQVNHGQDFRAFLYGAGLDIAVPGFSFVQLNFYRRDVPALSGATWQVTGVWSLPVALGATRWTLAGFADWAGPEGGSRGNLLLVPQLRLDLGALWDWPGRLEAGVEYSYWRNKFGIDGVVESVVQPMVKWTL